MNRRVKYLLLFLIFLLIEVMIALFINDRFIRPYIGDVLVVVVIYYFVRIFVPDGFPMLPLFIFLFAAAVEVLQYFNLVDRLGVSGNTFMRILLGSVFDVKDILCYGAGCAILGVIEWRRRVKYDREGKDVKTDDI